mmetsp:Transcript_16422/g.22909  ORF Transcript_16422/g.22909 Transcript_16422/m.22909 type:complete len:265 (-) Transcript_16422:885-1679(-)
MATTATLSSEPYCIALSQSAFATPSMDSPLFNSIRAVPMASPESYTSHKPSLATRSKSSCLVTCISVTSGVTMIGSPLNSKLSANSCVQYPMSTHVFFNSLRPSPLKSGSPKARVIPKISKTLPSSTHAPTCSILSISFHVISVSPYALCSLDRSSAFSPLPKTARESPTLAMMRRSFLTRATVAVDPDRDWSMSSIVLRCSRSFLSVSSNMRVNTRVRGIGQLSPTTSFGSSMLRFSSKSSNESSMSTIVSRSESIGAASPCT